MRLDAEGHDEVARLGAAFNRMLSALERSVGAQRQLVADASHEFRTPLTSIRANAELLARGKTSGQEHDAIARAVVDQVDELDGLVSDVIELALDGDAETRFEDVRLDMLVASEVERMRRHAPDDPLRGDERAVIGASATPSASSAPSRTSSPTRRSGARREESST